MQLTIYNASGGEPVTKEIAIGMNVQAFANALSDLNAMRPEDLTGDYGQLVRWCRMLTAIIQDVGKRV